MNKELLSGISFGEMQSYGSIAAFPLFTPVSSGATQYITMSEAIEKKLIKIEEVSEGGSVPELRVISTSTAPVLMLSGEEVKGARQNRILNTSILLAALASIIIPVSCTERGRWSYNSPDFKDSGNISSKDVRQSASDSVKESLGERHSYASDQGRVWAAIEVLHEKSQTDHTSRTRAMDDAFKARKLDLDEAVRRFSLFPGQTGVLFFHSGKIAGLDLLSLPGAFARLHKKLVRSYVIDCLGGSETNADPEACLSEARRFLESIQSAKIKVYKSPGLGDDLRLSAPGMNGSVLVHDSQAIHACCFRTETQDSNIAGFNRRSKL